jgi:hypothetical protein
MPEQPATPVDITVDPGGVPLGPIPTGFGVGKSRLSNGSDAVVLSMQTPLGVQTYFLTSDGAEALIRALTEAKTGLTLAKNVPNLA